MTPSSQELESPGNPGRFNVNGLELLVVFDAASALMISYNRRLMDLASGGGEAGRLLTFDVIEGGGFPFNLKDGSTRIRVGKS